MNNSNRLLITGVSGLLGSNLAHYFKDKYEILGLYCLHPVMINGILTEECDLSRPENIKSAIEWFKPSIVIHCASLTNVDQCEVEQDLAKTINVLATRYLVESLSEDITLIYISTDSVYDGSIGNFSENSITGIKPKNYYGVSKYEGEAEALKHSNTLVLRTNIFGWNIQNKKSLGEWMLEELKAKRKINCFTDAYFSTIYTMELSRVIDIALRNNLRGVYNCGSYDSCSKFEFAQKIADCFSLDKSLVVPISIEAFNFKANRGKNLSLNVIRIQEMLNYKLPTIDKSIEAFYKDYKCGIYEQIKKHRVSARSEVNVLPYGNHYIDKDDIRAVVEVMRSERLTQGPKVVAFEEKLAQYCGAKYAVAVSSGTAALHLACLASGINEHHEVITTPLTFAASANCILYCNGRPKFADINRDTYNIDPAEIEKKITSGTKAMIPVHFAGLPCDMETIKEIADRHKLLIIEDACHALGAEWQDRDGKWNRVGSCAHSDMAVFSFHPVKHITTGEGGAILTNSSELYEKLLLLRSHGITKKSGNFVYRDMAFSADSIPNPWYYEMQELGFNYRITDMQCALGLSQLTKIDFFIARRRTIAASYNKAFENMQHIRVPVEPQTMKSAWHLYVLQMDYERLGKSRFSIMNELSRNGIGTQVHYIPVHLQPYYRSKFGFREGDYPLAEEYYGKTLSLPFYPKMTDGDVKKVIAMIFQILKRS